MFCLLQPGLSFYVPIGWAVILFSLGEAHSFALWQPLIADSLVQHSTPAVQGLVEAWMFKEFESAQDVVSKELGGKFMEWWKAAKCT